MKDAQQGSVLPAELRVSELFDGFSDPDLERIAQLGDLQVFDAGAQLTEQGRVGLECFVLLAGSASVYVGRDLVANVGPGSTIGEMALLEHLPRVATVITDSPVRAVAFDLKAFRRLLDQMPATQERLLALLEERSTRIRADRTPPA